MSNITITNNDLGSVILKNATHIDELLVFAGAATVVEGTLLARQAIDAAVVVAADVGNTGDGTVTASVVGVSELPVAGIYELECTFAVAEGGVFKLTDPAGNIVKDNLTLRVGSGLVTTFNEVGLQIVVTDGATDFAAGDKFTATVVANGKMVPFAIGGVAGAGIPKAILTYDVTATGAGNEAIRSMISGWVRQERLIIDADGDGSNITSEILDQLRDFTIVSEPVTELNILDNQ